MLRKTSTAVIGVGNMGRHHARVYSELSGARLLAVADVDETVGQKISEQFKCRFYSDYEKMLDSERIEALSICVPTSLHNEVALACIKRRIPVLIEKPIAESIKSARAIIGAAKKRKVKICVGHIERFNPVVNALRRLVLAGKFGEITAVHSKRAGPFPHQIFDADVILDLAVHDIDILKYLLRKTPRLVEVRAQKILNTERFDYADILLRYGGVDAMVNVDWTISVKIRQLTLTGTKACAEADYLNQTIKFYPTVFKKVSRGQSAAKCDKPLSKEIKVRKAEPLKIELEHFLKFVRGERSEVVLTPDALLTLSLVLKAIDWARHHH